MSNNCHFHPWDVRSFNTTCIDWCEHHNGKKHARALKQQMCEKLQLWLHLEIDTQDPLPAVLRRCNTRSERVNQIISIATSLNGSVCTFNDDSITNRYIFRVQNAPRNHQVRFRVYTILSSTVFNEWWQLLRLEESQAIRKWLKAAICSYLWMNDDATACFLMLDLFLKRKSKRRCVQHSRVV